MIMLTKEDMERIWRERPCQQINALCRWISWTSWKSGTAVAGTPKNTTKGAAAAMFWSSRKMRKSLGGHDVPSWDTMERRPDIEPSAALRAKMKRECPRNWRALVAAFGKTRTKYDAPLHPLVEEEDQHPLFVWANMDDPIRRAAWRY